MQRVVAPSAIQARATASRSPRRPGAPPQACLRVSQQLGATPAAAAQLQRRRPAAARRSAAARLAVHASMNYGAEWATPGDAYLTVVRLRLWPVL